MDTGLRGGDVGAGMPSAAPPALTRTQRVILQGQTDVGRTLTIALRRDHNDSLIT